MGEVLFTPFWRVTRWGFLSSALLPQRGCDEWHNPSSYVVIPMVGMIVWFPPEINREGDPHVFALGPDGWIGQDVADCEICQDVKASI